MQNNNSDSKYGKLRWWLFTAGIIALLCLTLMNVFSLYRLHYQTVETDKKSKTAQLNTLTYDVRNRFYKPFLGFSKLNMAALQQSLDRQTGLPENFTEVLKKASKDSLFEKIYFTRSQSNFCNNAQNTAIKKFKVGLEQFSDSESFPQYICDSFEIAQTKMVNLLEEGYRWNNKVFFDDHRTMTLALINLSKSEIVGYLGFAINRDYLLNKYFPRILQSTFSDETKNNGVVVWLRDWTQDEVLASNKSGIEYNSSDVFESQKFPNLFDSWHIAMAYTDKAAVSASKSSLTRNLIILGIVFLLLLGTLVFIFTIAQRERELSKRQATFLANVTHELKTPLAVMQAAGENLADGRVTDKNRLSNYGDHIYKESIRLRSMIEKLLDVAKADAGQVVVNAAPENTEELLRNLLDEKKEYLAEEDFSITFDTSSVNNGWIMVDADHFETIIRNLLDNAVKYSNDKKQIEVSLEDDSKWVHIKVADHGIGIPNKIQKNIFEKFYRAEDSLTARTKGHGLGLSIVQNLVTLNGGEVSVDSKKGVGTTFTVSFKKLVDFTPENSNEQLKQKDQYYAEEQYS